MPQFKTQRARTDILVEKMIVGREYFTITLQFILSEDERREQGQVVLLLNFIPNSLKQPDVVIVTLQPTKRTDEHFCLLGVEESLRFRRNFYCLQFMTVPLG